MDSSKVEEQLQSSSQCPPDSNWKLLACTTWSPNPTTIHSLPSEIIATIFEHCLPPYPKPPQLIGQDSPTYLLGICRTWRDIALHSPELWRAVDCYSRRHLVVVLEWLQRSKSRLLSLSIVFELGGLDNERLLQALVAHRTRWEYAQFWTFEAQSSRIICGPAPHLKELAIRPVDDYPRAFNLPPLAVDMTNGAFPRIVSLTLLAAKFTPGPAISWSHLQTLSLMHTSFVECASNHKASAGFMVTYRLTQVGPGGHQRKRCQYQRSQAREACPRDMRRSTPRRLPVSQCTYAAGAPPTPTDGRFL
ncbi:hypothetical protein MIND_01106000 [Mycena indigotica]|uniref:F-box domain-containing protein n=1 Tax=Mycena indigotica TaxID=2126181 RepID=A0A8H6SB33_9AGAR|nr:uncharacterized protein MIND_01106000 [Mycena indigotica]KAF7295658.1 hypothetical protein MIND_01106000 [Mycena indigotica]